MTLGGDLDQTLMTVLSNEARRANRDIQRRRHLCAAISMRYLRCDRSAVLRPARLVRSRTYHNDLHLRDRTADCQPARRTVSAQLGRRASFAGCDLGAAP